MPKFSVEYTFQARASETIEARSEEEARAIIEAKIDDDDYFPDADDFDDLDFSIREMHPVTRDGRKIWTTYVFKSDVRGHETTGQDQ